MNEGKEGKGEEIGRGMGERKREVDQKKKECIVW